MVDNSNGFEMTPIIFGVFLSVILKQTVYAANILALNVITSHSHTIYTNVVTRALAARGHKLVVLSLDEERHPNPNITTIFLEGGYDDSLYHSNLEDLPKGEGVVEYNSLLSELSASQCEVLLSSPGNKRFYHEYKNRKFDLILIDVGFTECFLKYAHVFGYPPIVAYSALFTIHANNMGNFDNPAYIPHFISSFTDRMSFSERFSNWIYYHYTALFRRFIHLPMIDKISDKFFGFYEPTIEELEKKIALVLMDEHFSINHPRPRVPATVEVAGLHIKPAKALPKDIEDFFAGATHGVIYFSLGSNFRSKYITNERKQMFLKAFSQLPQRVLWKYEDDTLQNIPQNLMVKKWCPQTDILGHNKTVLFMTHNGYLSTQEAIYFGVPTLGIPILADQWRNSAKAIKSGFGLRLDLRKINNSEEILNKIQTIINNPSFKEEAERLSKFYRDRPMSPLDTAIYWVEYVLRYKAADQLKVASLDLAWYQYYLLDIYLTLVGSILVIYYALIKLIRAVFAGGEKQKKA